MLIDSPHLPDLGKHLLSIIPAGNSRYPDLQELMASTKAVDPEKAKAILSRERRDQACNEMAKNARREALRTIQRWIAAGCTNPTAVSSKMHLRRQSVAQKMAWGRRLGYLGLDEVGNYFIIKVME